MGCTASVLDYDQQQEWGRSKYPLPVEAHPSSKPTHGPEQCMIPSRGAREERLEESFGEVFVDDELSKLNESERAMYDGSVDGCSKAGYSINESVATRLDISKSVATDEALCDDTSSESEVHVHLDDTPEEVSLYPISVDGDEDLSRGDSLIASSMAPDPILNEEESNDEIVDIAKENTMKVTFNQGDICFTPRSPEANTIDAKRTECDLKSGTLSSFFTASLNEKTDTTPSQKFLNTVNATRNTSTSRGKSTNSTTRIRSGKPDKSERRIQPGTSSSVASLSNSRSLTRTTQISLEKAKLRGEIDRLRQQIQKLESKGLTVDTSKAFVPPSDLVIPIDDGRNEDFNTLKESSNPTRSVDSTYNSTLTNCVSVQNFSLEASNDDNLVQKLSLERCGAAIDNEMIYNSCRSLQTSQETSPEIEFIADNHGNFSNDVQEVHILMTPERNKSPIQPPRTEDSKDSFDSAHMQYSASTTDREPQLGGCQNGDCGSDDVPNFEDNTANPMGTLTQKSEETAAEILKTHQSVTMDTIVEPNQKIDNIDKGAHASSRTEHVNSLPSEMEQSDPVVQTSDTDKKKLAHEAAEFIEEESDDEATFVNLLNSDPWDEDSKLDESKLLHLINCHPYYCSAKHCFDGFHGSIYPLSAVCALGASLPTIKKCYHAFPDAITQADAWVGTCLHYACSYRAPFLVVEYLAKKNPLALKAVNQFNRLPLHMACMFGADADVVAYLTRKYPGAAKKVDKLGMLPLHIACDSDIGIDSPNWSVVEVLAEACPEACLTKCEYGATPLAICVARKAPIPVLEALIKACPEALSEADKENHIPLQSALTANASLDVIRLLVDNYPNGLLTENSDNETPFDFGVRMDLDSVILDVLATKKKSC